MKSRLQFSVKPRRARLRVLFMGFFAYLAVMILAAKMKSLLFPLIDQKTVNSHFSPLEDNQELLIWAKNNPLKNTRHLLSVDESLSSKELSQEPEKPSKTIPKPKEPSPKPDKPNEPASKPEKPKETVSKTEKPKEPVSKPEKPKEPVSKPEKPKEPVSKTEKPKESVSKPERPNESPTAPKSEKTSNESEPECTPPAIEQFPMPLMSQEARKNGGLIVHIMVTVYLFVAIAIICDDHFVPSLEMICDRMELSEDVAGATFMAAGSSAPELATALIAVFIAKDDIGISGVIGSAVFNILFVIAVCALFAGHVVRINWWPLMRDCAFYCISIFGLLVTIVDKEIAWYESIFLLILYAMYILVMFYNRRLEDWATGVINKLRGATREEKFSLFGSERTPGTNATLQAEKGDQPGTDGISPGGTRTGLDNQGLENNQPTTDTTEVEAAQPKSFVPEGKDVEEMNLWEMPVGLWERIVWSTTLPLVALHFVTVPDCRKVRWRRWYIVTFIMSMIWIAVYSYIMVWMITIIGFTLGIPDTVMGLTFIAIGVSVPDALSSLCVAKQGFGDMAISNAIGSNVFDILICLGVPWFLKTCIFDAGSVVPVESKGLTYSTLTLFSTVLFLILATHFNNWKLDIKYGIILLVWYLIFMILASLYELNIFGDFNLPECASNY